MNFYKDLYQKHRAVVAEQKRVIEELQAQILELEEELEKALKGKQNERNA